jgi:hypothetical protein
MHAETARTARRWCQRRVVGKGVLAAALAAIAIQGHAAALPRPADGTLVRVAGDTRDAGDVQDAGDAGDVQAALIVGGAPVPLTEAAAVRAATVGADRIETLSPREYRQLPAQIADGTFVRAPGGPVWGIYAGRRSALGADEIPLRSVQLLPVEVLALIPALAGNRTPAS